MKPDLHVLQARATSLRQNLERISRLASLPDEQFWSNELHVDSVKLHLIQAMEDAASICTHLIARLGGTAPSAYAECFASLHQRGVIDEALARRLQMMARFRNLLVHRYWQVDDQQVLRIAREDVGDLLEFLRQVGAYLGTRLM
ncbi:MAG: DUF86 domain-containing protein [Armatimonadota bacterium]|nr:DUF86 domain-containing protein [Armatimonadota bacterium]